MRLLGIAALVLGVISFVLWATTWVFWTFVTELSTISPVLPMLLRGASAVSYTFHYLAVMLICIALIIGGRKLQHSAL